MLRSAQMENIDKSFPTAYLCYELVRSYAPGLIKHCGAIHAPQLVI
jgi:hypothetical protein